MNLDSCKKIDFLVFRSVKKDTSRDRPLNLPDRAKKEETEMLLAIIYVHKSSTGGEPPVACRN